MGDDNAALEQEFLDAAITERETIVEPHALRDDLGGIAMLVVGQGGRLHGRLPSHLSSCYPVWPLTDSVGFC